MAINHLRDILISIPQAAKLFPKIDGKTKSIKTLYRYTTIGVRGVVLETYCDGHAVYTTENAVKQFQLAIASTRLLNTPNVAHKQSELCRKRSVAKANRNAERLLGVS